jgi:hypothetical protein
LQRRDSLVNAVGSVVVLTDLTLPVRVPPRDPFYLQVCFGYDVLV